MTWALVIGLAVLTALPVQAQRRFEIHSRGMLHETVFNTGEIGRAYHQGGAGNATSVPMMEWPGNSAVTIDDIRYDGKHYTNGAGIYISAQLPDSTARVHAFNGGVGASLPDATAGRWAFPLTLFRTENYPVLEDGTLNPDYDPNEAEEIITASWATPVGITVTRTSRAWSYPDYDDMIVYEYEFEYTGDRDGDTIPDTDQPITDVTIAFSYGFAGNLFGYQRTYNEWTDDVYQDNDQRGRFDPFRYLSYNLHQTGLPDPIYYDEWGATGENGGGLNAPGAPGYMMGALGIENVIASDEEWPTVGWESIARADPDVIVIAYMDRRRFPADNVEKKLEFLRNDPVASQMTAVQKGRIVQMDAHAMSATMRSIYGLETLSEALSEMSFE